MNETRGHVNISVEGRLDRTEGGTQMSFELVSVGNKPGLIFSDRGHVAHGDRWIVVTTHSVDIRITWIRETL